MKIELSEHDIAVITHCLLWSGIGYECENQAFQKGITAKSMEIYNRLICDYKEQTGDYVRHISELTF